MLPRLALVDPELTLTMPPPVTASTGLDALTQLLEPYVSPKANPLTDAFCLDGLHRVARSLRQAYRQGDDLGAREDMALASLLGGLALANARLGAVHGFAGVFGGMFDSPHGAVCAALLPHVTAINARALTLRDPAGEALQRYAEVAQILTGAPDATAVDGVAWVEALCDELQIPPLGSYGLTRADFPALTQKSARSSSMQGNPIKLTDEEMEEILERAL
jgi:alcohol dehydrogenase class IV